MKSPFRYTNGHGTTLGSHNFAKQLTVTGTASCPEASSNRFSLERASGWRAQKESEFSSGPYKMLNKLNWRLSQYLSKFHFFVNVISRTFSSFLWFDFCLSFNSSIIHYCHLHPQYCHHIIYQSRSLSSLDRPAALVSCLVWQVAVFVFCSSSMDTSPTIKLYPYLCHFPWELFAFVD